MGVYGGSKKEVTPLDVGAKHSELDLIVEIVGGLQRSSSIRNDKTDTLSGNGFVNH